ncbi:hypothetical protein H072_11243 [Dactylellina haptotyla CBS 200.50]|uniref:Amidase domain-containing protein n=1 Tax=Dactylellina haptotyla (strain CBS 200.50) TaxID=1284197 RepID=S7ZXE7_DACHA|nr:hypothetical protein H072_11243 [Dactylellina haptotyla CBS 200.50]
MFSQSHSVYGMVLLQLVLGVVAIPLNGNAATNGTSACKIQPAQLSDLIDITLDDLSTLLHDRCFNSHQLTQAYIARINEVNDKFHMVTEINPDALEIAKSLDVERASGKVRGPLHGVPILIKDNIATLDKMNNTASSFALLGAKTPKDSTMATKLRAAGAIILEKVGMSQWANFRASNNSDGWGARHGQITSPYYPNLNPSGSSSGSGVAASLGLSLGTLGTETAGSIKSPAERNCLVGIKPSVGLTSRYSVVLSSEHQDSVRPMARTVKDAAYLLSVMAGKDAADNDALKGAKIGIPREAIAANRHIKEFNQAVEVIRKMGATIVQDANFPAWAEVVQSDAILTVVDLDAKTNLKQYFSQLTVNPNNIHSLADMINFTKSDPREDYPNRGVDQWESALATKCEDNTCDEAKKAYEKDLYLVGEGTILGALKNKGNNLDALIMTVDIAGFVAALAGYPIVTVPMGFTSEDTKVLSGAHGLIDDGPKLPLGLAFVGRRFDEQKLINLAYAFEQETQARSKGPKPYIVPKAQVKDFL